MAKDWVEQIANELKRDEHSAGVALKHKEHIATVIRTKAPHFVREVIAHLQEDIRELNAALAGSPVDTVTGISNQGTPTNQFFIFSRAALPKFSYNIQPTATGIDVTDAVRPSRVSFTYHVGEHDGLSIREAFGENALHFETPAEFAKHLFQQAFARK